MNCARQRGEYYDARIISPLEKKDVVAFLSPEAGDLAWSSRSRASVALCADVILFLAVPWPCSLVSITATFYSHHMKW